MATAFWHMQERKVFIEWLICRPQTPISLRERDQDYCISESVQVLVHLNSINAGKFFDKALTCALRSTLYQETLLKFEVRQGARGVCAQNIFGCIHRVVFCDAVNDGDPTMLGTESSINDDALAHD